MTDCVFCKISRKEVPANIIYEDSRSMAFLDIHPINIGHTLVIPKKHFKNIFQITEDELAYLSKIVKKMSHAISETFKSDGIKVAQSNGEAAGQVVPHLHIHVIPFFKNKPAVDEQEFTRIRKERSQDKELDLTTHKIKKNL